MYWLPKHLQLARKILRCTTLWTHWRLEIIRAYPELEDISTTRLGPWYWLGIITSIICLASQEDLEPQPFIHKRIASKSQRSSFNRHLNLPFAANRLISNNCHRLHRSSVLTCDSIYLILPTSSWVAHLIIVRYELITPSLSTRDYYSEPARLLKNSFSQSFKVVMSTSSTTIV